MYSKPAEEKLADRIGRDLTIELTKFIRHDESSDLLEKLTSPRKVYIHESSASTTSTTTSTATSTTTVSKHRLGHVSGPGLGSLRSSCEGTDQNSSVDNLPAPPQKDRAIKAKYKKGGHVFNLDDFSAIAALETLVDQYGKVSHMGILDKSYSFFVTTKRDAALYFKVRDKIAVVGGDPLCDPYKYDHLLAEFATYRKPFGFGIAFLGATSTFAAYAQEKKWVTMQFGVERVLNPMTNALLLETSGCGKRMISQSKQLLRKDITLGVYIPKHGFDQVLQDQLVNIYESWCSNRNGKPKLQAYMTVYDPFSMPDLMTYIYTKDAAGEPCGFAALRKIVNGYHIDPCIAAPGAPRGISELLIISTMSLLHKAGVSYLSLGFEPCTDLGEITGLAKPVQAITRLVHRRTYCDLPIGGKRDFHNKFRPDEEQEANLYLVFPGRSMPSIKHMKAMMHIVNIDISKLIAENVKKAMPWRLGLNTLNKSEKKDGQQLSKQPGENQGT
jgi:lysylphosphatidylglycerol synthetase-like protein (DUF2156 family)